MIEVTEKPRGPYALEQDILAMLPDLIARS